MGHRTVHAASGRRRGLSHGLCGPAMVVGARAGRLASLHAARARARVLKRIGTHSSQYRCYRECSARAARRVAAWRFALLFEAQRARTATASMQDRAHGCADVTITYSDVLVLLRALWRVLTCSGCSAGRLILTSKQRCKSVAPHASVYLRAIDGVCAGQICIGTSCDGVARSKPRSTTLQTPHTARDSAATRHIMHLGRQDAVCAIWWRAVLRRDCAETG